MIRYIVLLTSLLASILAPGALGLTEKEPLVDLSDLPELAPTDLMSQETMRVIEMLETLHFNNAEISDDTFIELIREFMGRLDYNRLYFLESDEKGFIDNFGSRLSMQMRHKGNLDAAFAIYERYRVIAIERIQWILEKLEDEWAFDGDEEFMYDRSESPWPANIE
ncbi:MAG TPA: hypothetical protein DIV79_01245, partial [Opitutae bacterium]|nr:hypothetical protein [Opitutaceae bacterium]HCR28628.1 hypothetical protein [Opitutae bacterium]